MKICIHGYSLNAFVAAACLAEYGNQVFLYQPKKAEDNKQQYWFDTEPGLQSRFEKNQQAQRIIITEKPSTETQLHWLFCTHNENTFDESILDIIESQNKDKQQILISSQHPIGFYENLKQQVIRHCLTNQRTEPELTLIPRMVRESVALNDFEYPELLLIGGEATLTTELRQLLSPFIQQSKKTMIVSGTSAEMIRASTCAMLATRLSFMNEMASVAESLNLDIAEIKEAMASDSRIGSQYLSANCGFGGITLAEELKNLNQQITENGTGTQLLTSVNTTNELQKELLFRKFWQFYNTDVKGKAVAIWGAAFKAGSSSLVNSPIHPLIKAFWAQGVHTRVYDPEAGQALKDTYPEEPLLEVTETAYGTLDDADALLIVTDWKEFFSPDLHLLKEKMKQPAIFDGRNIYDTQILNQQGIQYFGIGRGNSLKTQSLKMKNLKTPSLQGQQ